MLLFDMSIESWIAQVGLHTIITFKVASLNIIFGSSFTLACAIFCAIVVITILITSACVLSLEIHLISLTKLIVWVTHRLTVLARHLVRASAHVLRHKASHHGVIHAHNLPRLLKPLTICTLGSSGKAHLLHHGWIHHVGHLTHVHYLRLLLHKLGVELLLVRCGVLLLVIVLLHVRILFRIKPRLE